MATADREIVPAKERKPANNNGHGGRRAGSGRKEWRPEPIRRQVDNPLGPPTWKLETQEEAWERARDLVRHYVAIGYPQDVIVRLLNPPISEPTLQKHFRRELQDGKLIQDAKIAGVGFFMASSGRHPDMTRFWLRARMGWRDSGDVPAGNAPIQFQKIEGDDW